MLLSECSPLSSLMQTEGASVAPDRSARPFARLQLQEGGSISPFLACPFHEKPVLFFPLDLAEARSLLKVIFPCCVSLSLNREASFPASVFGKHTIS